MTAILPTLSLASVHGRLSTQSLTLPELLQSRPSFVLPATQRVYGWQEEHVTRWFADASARAQADDTVGARWFFLGTIYLAGRPGDAASIADGQQRIVTSTMIYAAGRDLETEDPVRRAALAAAVVNESGAGRVQLRDVDAAFFYEWVQADGATVKLFKIEDDENGDSQPLSDSQSNIINNRNLIIEKLRSMGAQKRRDFFNFLARSTELVVINAPRLGDSLAAYASTHKRGLRQATTDKLKSELIGDAPPAERAMLGNLWDECEAQLGKDELEDLLQLMTFVANEGPTNGDLQTDLCEAFDLPRKVGTFVADRLVPATAAYQQIRTSGAQISDYCSFPRLSRGARRIAGNLITLNRITLFSHGEWRAPVLTALLTFKDDPSALERVLGGIDRMAAAFMLAGHEPHDCWQRYAQLCRAISSRNARDIDAALVVDGTIKRRARLQLASPNFGQKTRCRMPVLLKVNPPELTCEHILPQNVNAKNLGWRDAFRGDNGRYIGATYRHRLGNMTILTHVENRRADDKLFSLKLAILSGSTLQINRVLARETTWSPAKVDARTATLSDMIIEHWQL